MIGWVWNWFKRFAEPMECAAAFDQLWRERAVVRQPNNFIRGLKDVPVRLHPI